jgi:hypothetical protein
MVIIFDIFFKLCSGHVLVEVFGRLSSPYHMYYLWECRIRFILLLLTLFEGTASYDLVQEYGGSSFFDGWDFYGSWDNLTLGKIDLICQT